LLLVLGVGGALFGIATAVQAGISDSSGVIHSCYDKVNGQLRVIDVAQQACNPSEYSLSWSETGPKGTTGSTGATGPTGKAGASGAQGARGPTGTSGMDGAPGATGVKGPTGERGPTGANGTDGTNGERGPTGPGGTAVSLHTMTTYGYVVINMLSTVGKQVDCPVGTTVVGGGAYSGLDSFQDEDGNLTDSTPSGNGWYARMYNPGPQLTITLNVIAICASVS
jgi:hypothetical protein